MTAGRWPLVLQPQGDDVGTAVVAVVGATLLTVLATRLTIQAVRARSVVARPEAALWEYFAIAGALAALYGAIVLGGLATERPVPYADALLLGFVLMLALAMREAYYDAVSSSTAARDGLRARLPEAVFVTLVAATAVGPVVRDGPIVTALASATAVAIVAYGMAFQYRRSAATGTRGTLIDGLLRQTVPMLVFAGGAMAAPALALGPIDETVATAVAGVFVLVTAAAMMTVTIRLSQHLSSRR